MFARGARLLKPYTILKLELRSAAPREHRAGLEVLISGHDEGYRSQYTIVLIIGSPIKVAVPPNFGLLDVVLGASEGPLGLSRDKQTESEVIFFKLIAGIPSRSPKKRPKTSTPTPLNS